MPACALTISPSAQKVTPSPYGSERPCRQKTSPNSPVSIVWKSSKTSRLLPIPGTPTSVTSCGSRSRDHARERLAQQRELLLAPDERRASDALDADARSCPQRLPDGDRLALPFASTALRPRRTRSCARSRGTSSRRRGSPCSARRLQPRGGVDDVARGHALARLGPRVERDERLAGRDADADLELALLRERVADRERGADGSLGVVLVRDRRAEDRHHRVADELLDRAAEALELGANARVVGLEQRAHVLGVHAAPRAR